MKNEKTKRSLKKQTFKKRKNKRKTKKLKIEPWTKLSALNREFKDIREHKKKLKNVRLYHSHKEWKDENKSGNMGCIVIFA